MTQAALNFDALPESAKEGMARCLAHSCPEWQREVDGAIRQVALSNQFFTADDVHAELERNAQHFKTHNPSAIGPKLNEVAKSLKWMHRTTEWKRSERDKAHGNLHRVWKSNLYTGEK